MNQSNTASVKTVLIMGATGSFGSALSEHMSRSGWQVRALTRQLTKTDSSGLIDWVAGDLDEPASLKMAAEGVDLIVHAVNVPYPKWDPLMLNYTQTIIDLAKANHAQLMFIGNVYNAGLPEGGVITEHTEHVPINDKGELRATLEDMLEAASLTGVRTTIMRFGDFFGPDIQTSNWFNISTKSVLKNKLTMPGPANVLHTWAYLPDAVKAMEQVASIRIASSSTSSSDSNSLELPMHMVLPFAGHVFSFSQLQSVIEELTGTSLKTSAQPWMLFKLLSVVWPLMKAIVSMRYLWNHDIQMDGSALAKLLGTQAMHTPVKQAVLASVPGLKDAVKKNDVQKND